jgi:hypothetical protein
MNLTTITPAQRIAGEIEQITSETIRFCESQINRIFSLANTEGQQSAIFAAFGTNGVAALQAYAAFQAALVAVGGNAPLSSLEVFQPQPDGSVVYVAPPAPEPAPQPVQAPDPVDIISNDE